MRPIYELAEQTTIRCLFKRLSRRHDNVDLALRNCTVEDDLKAVQGKGEAEVKFQEVGAG